MELDLAAYRRHAERVAVTANARDDAGHQMPRLGMIGRAEPQRVHRCNGPCPHGEDVPQNTADARRCPLIGFDERRVIMAFHFEDDAKPITDIDHTSVFARSLDHLFAGSGQGAEPFLRALVGTMLVPHG